jgi:hypothetical protein
MDDHFMGATFFGLAYQPFGPFAIPNSPLPREMTAQEAYHQ